MFIKKLNECGYEEALLGLSLSFYDHKIPLLDWEQLYGLDDVTPICHARSFGGKDVFWTNEKFIKATKVAYHLAHKVGNGTIRNTPEYVKAEKKFLASIFVWIYVQAPRSWWSEYDTYKVATTANSSSTMHTLCKRLTDKSDFEEGTTQTAIDNLNNCINDYNNLESEYYHDVTRLKMNLPEGWLQERQLCINYMTIQNILSQREGHRLKMWKTFKDLLPQLDHPELVYKER